LGLLDRIARDEALTLADLVQGREALAASVLSAGGLLRWGQRFLAGTHSAAGAASHTDTRLLKAAAPCGREPLLANAGPQTLFEKILTRHRLTAPHTPEQPQPGDGLFVRADWRFIHEYYTGMADTLLRGALGPNFTLQRAEQIVVFEDHTSYVDESPAHVRGGLIANMHAMSQAQRDFATRHGLRMHRTLTDAEVLQADGSNVAGISHAMVAEHYALPGQVVVGTDSHTPHSGALGCVAFGVGTTDMANAFVTGAVRVTLPECVRVALRSQMPAGVTAKDLMLHLLATPFIRNGNGVGKVFEFAGEGIAHLSTDERATLTNMCAELGGLTGIVAPDAETVRFLHERRGVDFLLEDWMHSDEGAHYAHHMAVDLNTLSPMVVTRVRVCRCPTCTSACASTSPTADRARRANARTLTITTRCWPGV
jgi:3-isopropylmalate/(R)-2-methylmalate dehydratase large subunit